jgi:hypothetical protein
MDCVAASRRYNTLTEHIKQAENYIKHLDIWRGYCDLAKTPQKQEAYYKKHKVAIDIFSEAHRYFDRHLNGRKQIPLDEWRKEYKELTVKRDRLLQESEQLRADVQKAETIKRNMDRIMGEDRPKRSRDIGL